MSEKPLTKKQRTILEAILFLIGRGELPTVREVGSLVGLRSPATVLKHLRVLEKASLISVSGKSRGIRISDPELLERVIQDTADGMVSATPSSGPVQLSLPAAQPPAAQPPVAQSPASQPHAAQFPPTSSEGRSPDTSSSGSLRDVLQSHLPSVARLKSCGFLPFSQVRGAAPTRRIPLAGSIAAGAPFESYPDGYVHDRFGSDGSDGYASDGYGGDDYGGDDYGGDDYGCGELSSMASSTSATSNDSSMLGIDPKVFCDSGDVLALRVEGNSMVNVGILDGDYAIIRRQNTVEEGEIAAVIINGEGTLKRWSTRYGSGPNRRTCVSLEPENDDFDPIEITEEDGKDVLVIGKYVGLVRGIQPLL